MSTLLTQLSWSSNLLILSNTKTDVERELYLNLAIKENYSVRELNRQLQSSYYERYLLSDGKAPKSITKIISEEDDFPSTRILDTYSLEFLDLPNEYSEKDLKTAIIKNFILEIGKDFTFIGDEYRVQVGNHEFFYRFIIF